MCKNETIRLCSERGCGRQTPRTAAVDGVDHRLVGLDAKCRGVWSLKIPAQDEGREMGEPAAQSSTERLAALILSSTSLSLTRS